MIEFIVLLLLTFFVINQKYRLAVKNGSLAGFVLNPLLYLVFFLFFYLILSNIFLLNSDFYDSLGFSRFYETTPETSFRSMVFYIIILLFYFFSRDSNLRINFSNNCTALYGLLYVLIGFFALIYYFYVAYFAYANILPLRSDRIVAFEVYVDLISYGLKYNLFVNFFIAYVATGFIFFNKNKYFLFLTAAITVLVFFIDYTHGGRGVSLKILIVFFLLYVVNKNKIPFIFIIISLLFIIIPSAIQRGLEGFDIVGLYTALGEFLLTRVTSDIVYSLNLYGDYFSPLYCSILSFFPRSMGNMLSVDLCFIGAMLQDEVNSPFGLASNLVTESIYYFGDYYYFSALIIGLFYYFFNKYSLRFGFIGFLVLLYLITTMQGMIRTTFYDTVFVIFYLLFSYWIVFVVLFFKKKIIYRNK